MMKSKIFFSVVLVFILLLITAGVFAQCPMCKAALESSNSDMAKSINKGILYLLAMPYVLFGVIAFVIFKSSRKN